MTDLNLFLISLPGLKKEEKTPKIGWFYKGLFGGVNYLVFN